MREVKLAALGVMATIYYPLFSFNCMSGLIDAVQLRGGLARMGISSLILFMAAKGRKQ